MIKIIDAKPEDVYEIKEVQKTTWLDTYPNEDLGITKELIEKRFEDTPEKIARLEERKKTILESTTQHTWIAKDEVKIVGFINAVKEKDNGRILAIYVLPKYQGMGVGKKMMSLALDWLGDEKIILVNVAEYNKKSIKFYKSFGFKLNGKKAINNTRPLSYGIEIPEVELELK